MALSRAESGGSVWAVRGLLEVAYAAGVAAGTARGKWQKTLAELWPRMSASERRQAAARMEGLRFVREAMRRVDVVRASWAGHTSWPGAVGFPARDVEGGAFAEGGGLLVVAWHAGLGRPLLAALEAMGRTGILLKFETSPSVCGFEVVATGWTLTERARAFATALDRLRRGETVVVFLDAQNPARPIERPRPMLGRVIGTTVGPAALARLSGVSTVVAESTWVGGRAPFRVRFGGPVAAPADRAGEEVWTDTLYAELERRIEAAPGELWPVSLSFLTGSPRAPRGPGPGSTR